jgi:hypothetical protein
VVCTRTSVFAPASLLARYPLYPFPFPHRRACVPSLFVPPLSVAHACTHTQHTLSSFRLCIRVDDSSIIHVISAASRRLNPSRTLLFFHRECHLEVAVVLRLSGSLSLSPVTERSLLQPVSFRSQDLTPFSSSQNFPLSRFPSLYTVRLLAES